MERRTELPLEFGAEIVEIELTTPPPSEGVVGVKYRIEGTAKAWGSVGAPPWVYAEACRKEWWKPDIIEQITYSRGIPIPITGNFSINWTPTRKGLYEVTVVATPAPLSIPMIGVPPVMGKSAMTEVSVGKEEMEELFDIQSVKVNDRETTNKISDTDFDYVTPTPMSTSDKLKVNFGFEWIGPAKTVAVKIRAGCEGLIPRDFVEITPFYTRNIQLPDASETEPFHGELSTPIEIPLTSCGNIHDGAVEINVDGAIFQVWNVYDTKAAPPEEMKGTITVKKLKYDADYQNIPATNIPIAVEGQVHIWGRNDMGTSQKLGIHWTVKAPDGTVIEDYEDWEFGTTGPGGDHHFIGSRFDMWYAGYWTIDVELRMNRDNPVTVDSYTGRLADVAVGGLEPPESETLPAEDITHYSATIKGRLIETSYWSNVDVYFEWGETTSYGNTTNKMRMYEGDEGREFQAVLTGLKDNTTYHFRAVVEAVGYRSDEVGPGYGADMTFTTEEALVDVYRIRYFHDYNGTTGSDEPVTIPLGDGGGCQFNYRNISGRTLYNIHTQIHMVRPDGSSGPGNDRYVDILEPDEVAVHSIHWTPLDEVGTWMAEMRLWIEGELYWEFEGPMAYVV